MRVRVPPRVPPCFLKVWRTVSDRYTSIFRKLEDWPVQNYACFVLDTSTGSEEVFGDYHRIFKWASVSKLATAIGILSAVSEGVLGLEEELPNGSLLCDVLAHASGLATEIDLACTIFDQRPAVAPRTRRIYSNAGFELLGASLERSSGFEFSEYMSEVLFSPSVMGTASISGNLWPHAGRTGAAAGILGTLGDLLALARALLWGTPFLDPALLARAKVPFLPELPGILPGFGKMSRNDWGLGIEIRGDKSPHWTSRLNSPSTFGHFGAAGTFLWIDPECNLSVGVLTDREFGPWAQQVWPELSSIVLGAYGHHTR